MTDYAAAPAQPIVQGLLTARNLDASGVVTFFGIGIVQTGPNAPIYVGAGHYILTLDPGLPGDVAIDPPFGRFMMTVRGPGGLLVGTPTAVDSKSINYIQNPVPGVGADKIEILLNVDPETGLEIVLWRADAGVELVNANLIGPIYPNH